MLCQIEVTTFCNFRCVYCTTHEMPNKHIEDSVFYKIIDDLEEPSIIHLQGEGEPTLHPNLFIFAKYCKDKGHKIQITTNGSYKLTERFKDFDCIFVSIDTLDLLEANKIGRKIDRIVENIDTLLVHVDSRKIWITLVDYGQNYDDVLEFCKSRNLTLNIQKIQSKDDYVKVYADFLPKPPERQLKANFCERLAPNSTVCYYDVNGIKLPCCFMKEPSKFVSKEFHSRELLDKKIPKCCSGCFFIM